MSLRKHWYFCPHWERFLIRGDQGCLICEPPRQVKAPLIAPVVQAGKPLALRAIFPILNDRGDPLRASHPSLAS
jgi:hypothetical protein